MVTLSVFKELPYLPVEHSEPKDHNVDSDDSDDSDEDYIVPIITTSTFHSRPGK